MIFCMFFTFSIVTSHTHSEVNNSLRKSAYLQMEECMVRVVCQKFFVKAEVIFYSGFLVRSFQASDKWYHHLFQRRSCQATWWSLQVFAKCFAFSVLNPLSSHIVFKAIAFMLSRMAIFVTQIRDSAQIKP